MAALGEPVVILLAILSGASWLLAGFLWHITRSGDDW